MPGVVRQQQVATDRRFPGPSTEFSSVATAVMIRMIGE
jgi:hypothetical protein